MKTKISKDCDVLNMYVKRDKLDEVLERYKCFKWNVVSQEDNARYEDLVDVTFVRPHKINNKDELQLLQVYMEERLNESARIERNKNAKSSGIGFSLGLIGAVLVVLGILIISRALTILSHTWGIVIAIIGLIMVITTSVVIPKVFRRERSDYNERSAELLVEINGICKQALELTGGDNNATK